MKDKNKKQKNNYNNERIVLMKRLKGFTLAEVLITLAIIGVVAAISIPSVISNSQQQEFKTGLRKAVSVLNSAITMNMAIDGETPLDNANTFAYLQRHMSVIKSLNHLPWISEYVAWDGSRYRSSGNAAFYTNDGMRFETDDYLINSSTMSNKLLKLHESNINACMIKAIPDRTPDDYTGTQSPSCGGCGSYGLKHNPNNTTKPPCAILVDVNGDRKPTPSQPYSTASEALENRKLEKYWIPDINSKRVSDIFVILITEDRAIPYGVVAQKAMYQAQK